MSSTVIHECRPEDTIIPIPVSEGQGNGPEAAVRAVEQKFPQASEDAVYGAICQEGDTYYLLADQARQLETPHSVESSPQADRFRVPHNQASIEVIRGQLAQARLELAQALRTRRMQRRAEKEGGIFSSLVKFGLRTAESAFSFGVVTEFFGDIGTYLYLRVPHLANQVFQMERREQMERIMVEENLCGNLPRTSERPFDVSLIPQLVSGSAIGLASMLGFLTLGVPGGDSNASQNIGLSDGNGRSIPPARERLMAPSASVEDVTPPIERTDAMGLQELAALESSQADEMERLAHQLTEVTEQKVRISREVIDGDRVLPTAGPLGGPLDWLGIGLGFGIGTRVLQKVYHRGVPWRFVLGRGKHLLTDRARTDARREIGRLIDRGDLRSCEEVPSPRGVPVPVDDRGVARDLVAQRSRDLAWWESTTTAVTTVAIAAEATAQVTYVGHIAPAIEAIETGMATVVSAGAVIAAGAAAAATFVSTRLNPVTTVLGILPRNVFERSLGGGYI